MIEFVKKLLFPLASRFFQRALLVEGRLKGAECLFRCLFVDNTYYNTSLITARIFAESPVVLRRFRIINPALRKRILANPDSADLCIAVLPMATEPSYRDLYTYKCTTMVRQSIDISGPWDVIRKNFKKRIREQSRTVLDKYGLTYRISKSLEDFNHFYHQMYVAHTKRQFKDTAVIAPYERLKEFFLTGGVLIFIVKDGADIAGSLFRIEGKTLNYYRLGVLDGSQAYIKDGAQFALYYFLLTYAKENNLDEVNLRGSAPFLSDGVYKHKRAWGSTVQPFQEDGLWVYYFCAKHSVKIATFFEQNPLIACTDQGLVGIVGTPENAPSPERLKTLTRPYHARGIKGFTVVTPTETLEVS